MFWASCGYRAKYYRRLTRRLLKVLENSPFLFKQFTMATVRKIIKTSKAPGPIAAYNQAVVANNMLYISGQMGLDSETKKFVSDDAGEQTRQTMLNIGTLLELGGSSFDRVVKVTVLLQDINDFQAVNDVYKTFFKDKQPARAAYAAANLPIAGGKVEIEAIAIVGDVIDE